MTIPLWWWLAPAGAVMALVFAWRFYRQVMAAPPGDQRMCEIAEFVREGAFAYLKRQYAVVAVAFAVLVLLLAWHSFGLKQQHLVVPFDGGCWRAAWPAASPWRSSSPAPAHEKRVRRR